MLFVVIGHDSREAQQKRPQLRPGHLANLEELDRAGRVVLAGPLTDGAGSLIVLDLESLTEVWEVLARDPYVTEGVFESVEVRPFQRVFPKL